MAAIVSPRLSARKHFALVWWRKQRRDWPGEKL